MQELIPLLERIATALETIASNGQPVAKHPASQSAQFYLSRLNDNADVLSGRMTLQEIAFALGLEIDRGGQAALGAALTAFGATKGKSGSTRYYVFP